MNKHIRMSRNPAILSRPLGLFLALAALGSVASACDETVEALIRGEADDVDFGQVSTADQVTQFVEIRNIGTALLNVTQVVSTNPEVFRVQSPLPATVLDGIPPTQSATVAVTYRPCPAVFNADGTRDLDALPGCAVGDQSATLDVLDNSAEGGFALQVFGTAVRPPQPNIRCSAVNGAEGGCGETSANFADCGTLGVRFGSLDFTTYNEQNPCDMYVRIQNEYTDAGEPVAPLRIFGNRLSVLRDDVFPVEPNEVSLELLRPDGSPPQFPLTIEAEGPGLPGEEDFILRMVPRTEGNYTGTPSSGNGLTFSTNNPTEPEQAVPVAANVTAPRLAVTFGGAELQCGANLPFRGVAQNESRTETVSLFNEGTANLENVSVFLDPDDDEFSIAPAGGGSLDGATILVGNILDVEVTYSNMDGEPDVAGIVVRGDGVNDCNLNLAGGQTPQISAIPSNLQFTSTGGMEECRTVEVTNDGDADLVISNLRLEGTNPDEPTPDDFNLSDCAEGETECGVDFTVEPDGTASIEVCYNNDDSSFQDSGNLIIGSNDPFRSEIRVSLSASDRPCLAPALNFTLDPAMNQSENDNIIIDMGSSFAGGPAGGDAVITLCEFTIRRGNRTGSFNPNPVTSDDGTSLISTFSPGGPGATAIEVVCTNSCGASSSETISLTISPE